MSRGKQASLLFVLIVLGTSVRQGAVWKFAAADVGPGLIEGTVHYEDGNPVKGAKVYSEPIDRAMAAIVPSAKTDASGHFEIPHLWLGKFALGAEKLDEDYPNMTMQFYNDGKFETIILSSERPAASVSIVLGPKAGILKGTVADAITGADLNPCVEFRRAKEPNNFLAGTGLVNAKYRALVPSSTDVLMKVWFSGHRPWYYPGTADEKQSRSVNLKPGEETELDIRLEPDSSAPDDGCGMPVGTVIKP